MKGEDISPVKKGKGCRKCINNAKYMDESDSDTESLVRYYVFKCSVSHYF